MDEPTAVQFARICRDLGPGSVDALRDALRSETETAASGRAREIIHAFGARAVSPPGAPGQRRPLV